MPSCLIEPKFPIAPSLIQSMEVREPGGTAFCGSLRRPRAIASNSGQVAGVLLLLHPATSTPALAISVGKIYEKPSAGLFTVLLLGFPNCVSALLIFTSYQVTWISSPLRNSVGENSPVRV